MIIASRLLVIKNIIVMPMAIQKIIKPSIRFMGSSFLLSNDKNANDGFAKEKVALHLMISYTIVYVIL